MTDNTTSIANSASYTAWTCHGCRWSFYHVTHQRLECSKWGSPYPNCNPAGCELFEREPGADG